MREALGFLTPIGGARTPSPRALPWFPVVGALVGFGVGGVWWIGGQTWSPGIGAALAIIADLALTGMLHVDGLGDSADGLLPHLSPARRLEVMAKSDIGAFGVAAIGSALLLRFTVLASMDPNVLLIVVTWAAARRALAAAAITWVPYARPGGLAETFRGSAPLTGAAAAVALVALVAVAPAAGVACVLAFVGVVAVAGRRIGGYTGDVLGAAIVVSETIALLVAAA